MFPSGVENTTQGFSTPQCVLHHRVTEKIPNKSFNSEFRALKDVHKFLSRPLVFLNMQETTAEDIMRTILCKVFIKEEKWKKRVEETFANIFAANSVLSEIIQGAEETKEFGCVYDPSWVCILTKLPDVTECHVAIASLRNSVNFGASLDRVHLLVLVITPSKEKITKNSMEMGRTFATMFQSSSFRQKIIGSTDEDEIMGFVQEQAKDLFNCRISLDILNDSHESGEGDSTYRFAKGIRSDFKRRISVYISDYVDGFVGPKTLQKTTSTIFFLYFGCILPTIAFGSLNDINTNGAIDVRKCILAQTFGGLVFAIIGGQPLVIIMTTAPLCIYTKMIYGFSEEFHVNFQAFYACVGLWNTIFVFLYALFDASKIMKWCTRSTEEIFSLFIVISLITDAGRNVYNKFATHYDFPACHEQLTDWNTSNTSHVLQIESASHPCRKDSCLLHLLLTLGTVWLSLAMLNFRKTSYLKASTRDFLSDYALPFSVIALSFVDSFLFQKIPSERFRYSPDKIITLAGMDELPWICVAAAAGLGFALSLLFFMDHNISAATVNNPSNRLNKGFAYHFDLIVIGSINAVLSVFGLPWMHGVLPHSPLHARKLADIEEMLDQGHIHEVVIKGRETRVTGALSHALIGISLLMLPYPLAYIPNPVLDGLFLYMAASSLEGNQMFERVLLLFTEQLSYPPNYYIRRCPQREIHRFTTCQIIQLTILSIFGFYPQPYVNMIFPIIIILMVPFRLRVLPLLVDAKYLQVLDSIDSC